MPIYQAYNRRSKVWVKYKITSKGFKPLDVKQRNPSIKFKGVKVRGQRK